MDLSLNLQRASLNELTHEFRQLTMRHKQQEDWLTQWIGHAQQKGGPVRTELAEIGFSLLFEPDSFAWEFKVKVGQRDPLTFGLRHNAPWRCWDTDVRGQLAVLLASDGNGASMHTDEFVELSGQVKQHLGAYLKHFNIEIPPDGETDFSEYR
jgi:hypothetical protein